MKKPKLIKIHIFENNCIDGEPIDKSYLFHTTDNAKTVKANITKAFYDHMKKNKYKTMEDANYDGFYFGNQFEELIPVLEKEYNLKLVEPEETLEADFDTIFKDSDTIINKNKKEQNVKNVEVCAYPYATQIGTIQVPNETTDVKEYITNHWNEIEFRETELDYSGTNFEYYDEPIC